MTNAPKTPDDKHSIAFNRAVEVIEEGKINPIGHIRKYLSILSSGMAELRIEQYEGAFDDAVIASIESFIPRLAQFTELLSTITQYEATENYADALHKFFEELIPYLHLPEGFSGSYRDTDQDNFSFIIHELFLSTVAILLKEGKFDAVHHLISNDYYVESYITNGANQMLPYLTFCQYVSSINQTRNERLGINQSLLQSKILNDRTQHSGVNSQHLMQADFVLLMRQEFTPINVENFKWYPIFLSYGIWSHRGVLEIFARAESRKYFDKIQPLLGITKKDDVDQLFDDYASNKKTPPSRYDLPILKRLINFDKLATTP